MLLYHGSNCKIDRIDLSKSKPHKDFGKGLYLSDSYEQAFQMGIFRAEIDGGKPVITTYSFDENLLSNGELKTLNFKSYSKEWAEFIFNNRLIKNNNYSHDYDVVVGPVANDKVGAQIRNYMEKFITFDVFLKRIKYMKGLTFQYYFGTEKAISFLKVAD
ncbi:MAG: DUF3990 domain-containing protein [Sphaerochaetaceae bacterium]|nr:DUF3990 domain-containing protein [Sphaerochaetaceae bacterium]